MDRLLFGLGTAVIGMVVVFLGLVILILCIKAMHGLMSRKKAEPAPAAPVTPAAEPEAEEEPEEDVVDDGAVVAAISAALAVMMEKEESGFVVRRIRRVQNSTSRARAARDEQIFSRL